MRMIVKLRDTYLCCNALLLPKQKRHANTKYILGIRSFQFYHHHWIVLQFVFKIVGNRHKNIKMKKSYSDLPNNHAANLIIFLGKKHLHNLIKTYTFINFWDFLSKPDFHLHKWEKLLPTRLRTYTFINFWEIWHLHQMVLHDYLAG